MGSIPDDFGMGPVQTLSHVGDPSPAPDHSSFWNAWFERLCQESPVLQVREVVDPTDPTATHEFISTQGVRIGCRLITPPEGTAVRASLVGVHGYGVPGSLESDERKYAEISRRGVAVLSIRLRGYPGSRTDTQGNLIELDASDPEWVINGFDEYEHKDWVLPHTLADVCNAVRVMRNALLGRDARDLEPWLEGEKRRPDVYLHGQSLGGGLATIAAGLLSGRMLGRPIVDRLAIEVPSLGAWRWRLEHHHAGLSEQFGKVIRANPDRREELIDRLRLMDAVVHGRRVRVATLAMLAGRDEIAPAPTSAAVYNAVDADPGLKWRFCISYGHHNNDVANTRRVALYQKSLVDFFDPAQLPIESMAPWEAQMGLDQCDTSG